MNVIALISQKGGSGKTTLATALAVAHQQDGGRAAVADLDPQGSSVAWHHFRDGEPPLVAAVHPPRLDRSLRTFRSRGVTLALIDTAPHASAGRLRLVGWRTWYSFPCRPSTPRPGRDRREPGGCRSCWRGGRRRPQRCAAPRLAGGRGGRRRKRHRRSHCSRHTRGADRPRPRFHPWALRTGIRAPRKAAAEVQTLYRWAFTQLHKGGERE